MRVNLESFDIVSFDIFDTLLLRPLLRPRDLWLRIGGEEFARDRAQADRGGFETLDDAYALLPRKWQGLKNVELKCERECLVINPEMLDLWRMAGSMGKRRVIVSDMYLPEEFLQSILRENEIDGWNGFYVSCERKARKSDGSLYRIMLAEMNADPQKVVHIGDNACSDCEEPKKLGIHARRYGTVIDGFVKRFGFVEQYLKKNDSLKARCLIGALAVAWHRYLYSHPETSGWSVIGGLIGGVFGAAYVSMIEKVARLNNIDHLLFVARDGYSLKKIFNTVFPSMKTSYVFAPRHVRDTKDVAEKIEYTNYVKSLNLSSHRPGVVDTVSKAFSSQFLLSSAIGKNVFGFFAVALSDLHNGACFIYAPNANLRWLHFLELMFMAPTPPVMRVKNCAPVYMSPVSEEEQCRIDLYPSICEPEIDIATQLLRFHVTITPEMWLDYMDSFLTHMGEDERKLLSAIKNGIDINHTHYVPLFAKKRPKCLWYTRHGIPYKKQTFVRRGMKMIRKDTLLGLVKIRENELDL